MTVVITKEQLLCCSQRTAESQCHFCNGELDHPYLEWNDLFVCGPCCVSNKASLMADRRTPYVGGVYIESKRGLLADLVHCAAIVEMVGLGYRDETLVRARVAEVERAAMAERAASASQPVVEEPVVEVEPLRAVGGEEK